MRKRFSGGRFARLYHQAGVWIIGSLCLIFAAIIPVHAQEGHPLTGTWSGDWGAAGAPRVHLTIVMSWDGDKVTGTINPGPEGADLRTVVVDHSRWMVHLEAQTKDRSDQPVRITADGKLEDLGSAHRTLSGTWVQGATKGDFKIARE